MQFTLNLGTYDYPGDDFDLHGKVAELVQNISGDEFILETFFFLRDEDKIGILFMAEFPDGLIDKLSCGILTEYIAGLPKNRFMLFIDEPTGKLNSAIANK